MNFLDFAVFLLLFISFAIFMIVKLLKKPK